MLNEIWFRHATWAASVGLLLAGGAWVQAQDQVKPKVQRIVLHLDEGEVKVSEYWLGLECYPVDATLRSHLELAEGVGLIIEQVLPDSPAAKAGLKKHDVLLKAGEKNLKAVPDLLAAVGEAGHQELAVELIRGGKTISIKVAPAKRPQSAVFRRDEAPVHADILKFFGERKPGESPQPFNFRVLHPGAMFPGMPGGTMPKDLSISVTRQGDEPAKVTVKRGDKSWEATEGKLAELPDDVRPFVERMLGRGATILSAPKTPGLPPGAGIGLPGVPGAGLGGAIAAPKRVEIRRFESNSAGDLKDISAQIEMLRKQLDALQQALPKRTENPAEEPKPKEGPRPPERNSGRVEAEDSATDA